MEKERQNSVGGRYFIEHYFAHFVINKHTKIIHDEKTPVQKKFERYLLDNKILITDYNRVIQDRKYFEVVSCVITLSNKITCIYSSYDLSYKSDSCVFYSYDIPKNATEKQFKHIYNYLFIHGDSDRVCYKCDSQDSYYYCIDCEFYTCRECIFKNLKFVLVGKTDYCYIDCICGNTNILYKLPRDFTL